MNTASNDQITLTTLLARVVLVALWVMTAVGTLVVAYSFSEADPYRYVHLGAWVVTVGIIAFQSRLPKVGAVFLFAVWYLIGVTELLNDGLHGSHIECFVLATFLVSALIGTRGVVVSVLICSVTVVAIAAALQNGWLALGSALPGLPPDWTGWIYDGLSVPLYAGGIGFATAYLMRHLGESLDASRDSEQRYRLLADNVSDVVFMLSLDMQKTLFMSPSIELQRGYTPEEATAMSVVDSVSADTLPVVMGIYHQALNDMQTGTDRIYELEYELKHKDGHYIWNEGRITILRDADGAPSCFLGVNRNIADRKRAEVEHRELETQLRHIQRIESVGQLAGGIAHDFNNILVAITGYAELSLSNELGKEDRENLQGIIGSAERAAELTSRLLAFGSRQVVNLETVSLGDLVIGLEGMFNRLIREDIVLSIDVTDHALNVEADSGQLEQVLVNLVVNARDAMPTGGRLKILLDRAGADDAFLGQQSDLVGGDYASITVRDYGIGVPEDQDDHLFEPFFTTKPHGSGNGLGLSVVQGIVRQHQGHVTFNRRADGTDFVVYLPQSSQAATSPRAPAASGYSRQGSETILIAEDDEQVRIVVSKMLEQAGYRLIVAKDGLEALDLFERHEADIELILMDLVMPKLNGKDVLLKIRETNTTVPFLFSSGYFDDGEESDLLNDYDAELLQKPYVRNTLLETVRRMIDNVQPARRSAH